MQIGTYGLGGKFQFLLQKHPRKQQYIKGNNTEISTSATLPYSFFCTMVAVIQLFQTMAFLEIMRREAHTSIFYTQTHAHNCRKLLNATP